MKYNTYSEAERAEALNIPADHTDRTYSGIHQAFCKAAAKFAIRIKFSKKGTYEERIILQTNWSNCDEVQDYLYQQLNVSAGVVNGVIQVYKRNCK